MELSGCAPGLEELRGKAPSVALTFIYQAFPFQPEGGLAPDKYWNDISWYCPSFKSSDSLTGFKTLWHKQTRHLCGGHMTRDRPCFTSGYAPLIQGRPVGRR